MTSEICQFTRIPITRLSKSFLLLNFCSVIIPFHRFEGKTPWNPRISQQYCTRRFEGLSTAVLHRGVWGALYSNIAPGGFRGPLQQYCTGGFQGPSAAILPPGGLRGPLQQYYMGGLRGPLQQYYMVGLRGPLQQCCPGGLRGPLQQYCPGGFEGPSTAILPRGVWGVPSNSALLCTKA